MGKQGYLGRGNCMVKISRPSMSEGFQVLEFRQLERKGQFRGYLWLVVLFEFL